MFLRAMSPLDDFVAALGCSVFGHDPDRVPKSVHRRNRSERFVAALFGVR
jgi:hypothetical protein